MVRKTGFLVLIGVGLTLMACSLSVSPTVTPSLTIPATLTPLSPTEPAATSTLPPTSTSLPPTAPSLSDTPPLPANPVVARIFLIAIGDNGKSGVKIGCGDSVVGVDVQLNPTVAVLRAALTKLFSIKDQFYGMSGLDNALYQSNLKVDDLNIVNQTAMIALSGSLSMGGECDIPRVKAQLEQTALQFSTIKAIQITLNGKPLDDVLSLK